MRNRRPAGPVGGFTLLEVMLAISVLMIAVMAAMSSQGSSMNLIRASRESNTAMSDLQVAMEDILLTPQVIDIPVNYPAGQPIPEFTNLNLGGQTIVPTYPGAAGGVVPDPLEIVLVINWNDWRGRAMSSRLATVVAQ